jgi:predicted permease
MAAFWRRRTHDDFSDEVEAHLELETERLVAEGWSPRAARDAARRSFGNVALAKERFYEASRWVWLEHLGQDLRYAVRGLAHNPVFLATTVLTLAVGLSLITVAFTVFNAYVLRPYAVRDPQALHQVGWTSQEAGGRRFRWRDYEELVGRRDLFDAVIAQSIRFVSSKGRPLGAALVSGNYFEALGPAVQLGRGLLSSDAEPGAGNAAVLSHLAWTRLFAADPAAVGREIDLNGRRFIVVGVLGPEFTGLGSSPRDVWVALPAYAAVAEPDLIGREQPRTVEIVARLREGLTAVQAEQALAGFVARAMEARGTVRASVTSEASPNRLSIQMAAVLAPVLAAFLLVLVTACANVSNVMLARAIARRREIAVRLSIGASRGRVVRQLLTEGLLISILAGFAALGLAAWGLRAATVALFGTLPPSVVPMLRLVPMTLDHRVFLFALAVSAVATVLFALLPALQSSRISLTDALRGHGGAADRGSRLRHGFVIGQVAGALVLVIMALTLARNGAAVGAIDLGFETDGVISVNVRGDQDELARPLAEALAADPRVAAVAVTSGNPLFNAARTIAAGPAGTSARTRTRCTFVSPEFFPILRMPIARGRAFRIAEARAAARVAIISAATANAFWPGEDPIGKTIEIEQVKSRSVDELPGYADVTVVGVVRDMVTGMMVAGHDTGHIYLPMTPTDAHATAILVRGRTDRDLAAGALQEIFERVVPNPQVFEALPLGELRDLQMYPLLAASWVGLLLGAVALALSVAGLYGVLAYTVSQRTREIGIRIALGATAGGVVALVMRQSARLAAIGGAAGAAVAFMALQMLSSVIHLETVSLVDLAAFAGGLTVVLIASGLASLYPATRAARLDPAQMLRADA